MPAEKPVLHLISADCDWELATYLPALAAALRDKGQASYIAAADQTRLADYAAAYGVETVEFALSGTLNPLAWSKLGGICKQLGVGIVHAHDAAAAQITGRAAWFADLDGVVTTRYDLRGGVSGAESGGKVKAVVCPSLAVEKAFAERKAGAGKTRVVYAGANLAAAERALEERDALRQKYRDAFCPAKEKPLFLVDTTPLEQDGGHASLLEALPEIVSALPQTHLFIMSEGTLAPELERQMRIMALEKDVTFLEPDSTFSRLLAAADVFVSGGQGDVSGIMVQAAMAAGRAAALVDAGCHAELVENGKTGVLAPDASADSLRMAVMELLENRSRREHLGRMAMAAAAKRFNLLELAGTVAEVYAEASRS